MQSLNDQSGGVFKRVGGDRSNHWAAVRALGIDIGDDLLRHPWKGAALCHSNIEPVWSTEARRTLSASFAVDSSNADSLVVRYFASYQNSEVVSVSDQRPWRYHAAGLMVYSRHRPQVMYLLEYLVSRPGNAITDPQLYSKPPDTPADPFLNSFRIEPAPAEIAWSEPGAPNAHGITHHAGSLWAASFDNGSLVRFDPQSMKVLTSIPVGQGPVAVLGVNSDVWVTLLKENKVARVDVGSGKVTKVKCGNQPYSLAFAGGSLWVSNSGGKSLTRIDPATGKKVGGDVPCGQGPEQLVASGDTLWVSDRAANAVHCLDARSGTTLARISCDPSPSAIAIVGGELWVGCTGSARLLRFDSGTRERISSTSIGLVPEAFAVTSRGVWVTDSVEGSVRRIDRATGLSDAPMPLACKTWGVCAVGDSLFIPERLGSAIARIVP